MSDDLVTRLRQAFVDNEVNAQDIRAAAEEINRLRSLLTERTAELEAARFHAEDWQRTANARSAALNKAESSLAAALKTIRDAREALLGFGQFQPGQRINRAGAILDAALSPQEGA